MKLRCKMNMYGIDFDPKNRVFQYFIHFKTGIAIYPETNNINVERMIACFGEIDNKNL